MVGDQTLSQFEIEILPSDLIDDKPDSSLEKETLEVEVEVEVEVEKEKEKENDKINKNYESKSLISEKPQQDSQYTTDDLKEIQDDFSTMDKLKVMSILTNKLSIDEIMSLSGLASDGVDTDELNNIKKTLKKKLNTNDVEYLKGLYKNYN